MTKSFECKNATLEIRNGICIYTLNRPEEHNSLSTACCQELYDFAVYAEKCNDIRVIIITGAGEKAFSAGADVSEFTDSEGPIVLDNIGSDAYYKLEHMGKPVIAAINGYAFGGGFELSLACDIRIASDKAKFGLPELGLGVMPGFGGTQRLSRLVGLSRAKYIILTGKPISAKEAMEMGLVYKVVPREILMDKAIEVATELANKAPLSISLAKKAINMSMDTDLKTGLETESIFFNYLSTTEDCEEGTKAFFEKRLPQFNGR